ncbi:zf-HC2 domain-containing protein [Myxococcus sp. K15C18031901]|uniref:zf-HC2 domain-containing protein n=1 Tax=Myxococcus dinghuensis TaxID=2906761 RepID=UPI0020A73B4E|nr:zf-HC2 domain-containing protein [Myxococcus dinghuensis]MCP3104012.1 zf-HC2 domain-containing protein [Myxococcus dinghuensis]
MSACRENELDALLAGELSDEDAARVRAHAEGCAACRHALTWLRMERGWMAQRARRTPSRPALDFAALEARLAATAEPSVVPHRAPHESPWRGWRTMLMGAMATMACFGLGLVRSGPTTNAEEPWGAEVLVAASGEACEDAAAALEARVGACLIATPGLALRN